MAAFSAIISPLRLVNFFLHGPFSELTWLSEKVTTFSSWGGNPDRRKMDPSNLLLLPMG